MQSLRAGFRLCMKHTTCVMDLCKLAGYFDGDDEFLIPSYIIFLHLIHSLSSMTVMRRST